MKVRVKFTKKGKMKFIGHLDIMRYFQKSIRRANVDIVFSEGFSPHMIMSFAAPLGVGLTSNGEYVDIEINNTEPSEILVSKFNSVMTHGMNVLSVRKVPDGKASKAMSLVAAADYTVRFRSGKEPESEWMEKLDSFYHQPEIKITKKTKKSECEVDIKPMIYQLELRKDSIFMQLATGSVQNLKPELVLEAFVAYLGEKLGDFALEINREEVYADMGDEVERQLVSLEDLGEEII